MYKLDSHSLGLVLSALEDLHSDADPATLPERAVNSAMKMVNCDLLSFDLFSKDPRYEHTAWANDPMLLDPEFMKPFARFLHQHPIVKLSLANPDGTAIKITDAISQAEFERTDLYNVVYRQVHVNKQMGLGLLSEGDMVMTCAFTRKKSDFTDREKAIASLAAPHFVNAIKNGFAFGRISAALESGGSGVIALASGKTTFSSSFARHLLETYFAGETVTPNGLPHTLSTWLANALASSRTQEYKLPAEPFKVQGDRGLLVVRLLDNHSTREEILLLEERLSISPEVFLQFGLTTRECEVMYWITEGKTDPDIALLLAINIRTVEKHVENLYRKIGVETRTAALSWASDRIQ